MRNLWNLIATYHVILVFLLLQGLALSWFISSHGHPRGQWVQKSMEWQGRLNSGWARWNRLSELSRLNQELLAENAALRAALFALESSASAPEFRGAEVIRSNWSSASNYFILDRGSRDGLEAGQGLIQDGTAVGRIVEVSEEHSLAVPLINRSIEWSVRLGQSGPVARLIWNGSAIEKATLLDVPRSVSFAPGDSILTSGFQGFFPPGILVGTVGNEAAHFDGQFLNVPVDLATDYRSLRYVHSIQTPEKKSVEALINDRNVPEIPGP